MIRRGNKELKRFKLAVEEANDHIIFTDPEGNITFANKAVTLTTGYSHKEVIGKTPRVWGGHMPEEFYKQLWHTISVLKQPFVGEILNRRKNGEKYTAELHITPILDKSGRITQFVGIERDITKIKQLDDSKTEFVSLASHQLRTPLSTLSWYSEVMLSGDLGALNKKQELYIHEIYTASQRMIALVNDLLNLSRIEMDKVLLQPNDIRMSDVISGVIQDMKPVIKQKEINLNIEQPKTLRLHNDQQLLNIILTNLLTNAIKYTPAKGRITITITTKDDKLVISVKDSGYGITKQDEPKIFSKFFRAENIKTKVSDGTGLGLYIVKAFVEHAGGNVRFSSSEGVGTEFIITLPKDLKDNKVKH